MGEGVWGGLEGGGGGVLEWGEGVKIEGGCLEWGI